MKPLGSVASVVAAVREDAQAEIERIEKEAGEQEARLAVDDSGRVEAADREERLAAASREAREKLAREDWSDARAALEAREEWMRRAAEKGRALLQPPTREERRALLVSLAREALQRLAGEECTLHVNERDRELFDAPLLAELGVAMGPAAPIDGGCIVRSVKGKVSLDNSFEERARRFDGALRAALGKVYGS